MDSRDWHALPGPTWYRPAEAAAAARDLAKSASADDAASAVRRLVAAVGNDHGGTLYPAAIPAVRILLGVVRDRPGKPRIAALNTLLDWWGCFVPEPGYDSYRGHDGQPVDLIDAVEREIRSAAGTLRTLTCPDDGAGEMAEDLLAQLEAGSWSDLVADR
ncbi:hypothetical protein [Amycolatopsis sp. NPDC003676]